jgi:hypothetical protein
LEPQDTQTITGQHLAQAIPVNLRCNSKSSSGG